MVNHFWKRSMLLGALATVTTVFILAWEVNKSKPAKPKLNILATSTTVIPHRVSLSSTSPSPAVAQVVPDATLQREVAEQPRLLVVVPGHGAASRTPVLRQSLSVVHRSMRHRGTVSCLVFTYGDYFPSLLDCKLVNKQKFWLEFLMHLPEGALEQQDFVLLLQDDVLLSFSHKEAKRFDFAGVRSRKWGHTAMHLVSSSSTNVSQMIQIARLNCLDVLSPSLIGTHANFEYMRPYSDPKSNIGHCTVGRIVPAVEYQTVLFTVQAFRVLVDMMWEFSKVSLCWGIFVYYTAFFAESFLRSPRIGILDNMQTLHTSNETAGSRCTNIHDRIESAFADRDPPISIGKKKYRQIAPKEGSATKGLLSNCTHAC